MRSDTRSHVLSLAAAITVALGVGAAPFVSAQTTAPPSATSGNSGTGHSLLDVLLQNGTITRSQYDQLKAKQGVGPQSATESQSLLDVLLKNGAITQSQYGSLHAKQSQQREAAANVPPPHHALEEFKKFAPNIKVTGRLQVDALAASNDRGMIGDGQELRRAWFGIAGKIAPNWGIRFIYDFGAQKIQEATGIYTGFHDWTLTAGNTVVPFSLEFETSSNNIIFQERSMLNDAYNPGRLIGAKAGFDKKMGLKEATFTAGVFGGSTPSKQTKDSQGSGVGVAARGTFAWDHTDRTLMHVGAAVRFRNLGSSETLGQVKVHPDAHLAPALLGTGVIPHQHQLEAYELEAAAAFGPFSAQGQFMDERIKRSNVPVGDVIGSELNLNGYYVQAAYFLTGESRAAAYKGGAFGGIKPAGPGGAWQVAARFGSVNFYDGAFRGGKEENFTAALNWYTNSNVRFSLNYVKVLKLDSMNAFNGIKPSIIEGRFWLHF